MTDDDEPEEPEVVVRWEKLEIEPQTYLNVKAFRYEGYLIAQGENSYLTLAHELNSSECFTPTFGVDTYPEPISENWIINQNEFDLLVRPAIKTHCEISAEDLRVDLRELIDPALDSPASWQPVAPASRILVRNDQLLFPYRLVGSSDLHFALMTVVPTPDQSTSAAISEVTTFTLPGVNADDYEFDHWSLYDGFFVAVGGDEQVRGLYKIEETGEFARVLDAPVVNMLTSTHGINAMSADAIYRSEDMGSTFTLAIPLGTLSDMEIKSFANGVNIGLKDNGCFQIIMGTEEVTILMLDTEELVGQELYHVDVLFNRAFMFTNEGIYIRNWEDFVY